MDDGESGCYWQLRLALRDARNERRGNLCEADGRQSVNESQTKPAPSFHYIMGNPPFVGYSLQSDSQKDDILSLYRDEKGKPYKTAGKIDYVAGWDYGAEFYFAVGGWMGCGCSDGRSTDCVSGLSFATLHAIQLCAPVRVSHAKVGRCEV